MEIRYDDSTHTYWYGNLRYMSATQVIGLYCQEFDADTEAEKYVDKAGKSKEYWLNYWKNINQQSLIRGNNKHNLHEEITLNRSMDVVNGKPYRVQNDQRYDETLSLIDYPDGLYTEKILWSHEFHIAGRADRFALETVNRKRFVHIEDYKTNKKLRTHSFMKNGEYQMMKAPLDYLMDCEMVHYTLQLSEYMLMFEEMGFLPGSMALIHFPHKIAMAPEGAEDPPPVRHEIPYLKTDVVKMLRHMNRHRNSHYVNN